MRTTVSELEIAISVFGQLAMAFHENIHGIDEKKIETHVSYCKHLLDVAKVYKEAAELEEQQNRQKLELARQVTLAEEARRKAEEQQRLQVWYHSFLSFNDQLYYFVYGCTHICLTDGKEETRGRAKTSKGNGRALPTCQGKYYL